ncbi:MAG: hypothetical protein H0W30_01265 [Gemmatimonadaceae bacterium]|nr:hypothetical protein [Gemmatimonadaceae bacterium]MBA3557205.1 hypothetical protein [Gemmatimonadaceae bacterium]
MPTEREEINQKIDRHKAVIADHLVKMGVKPDVAIQAVSGQVRYGLSQAKTLQVNVAGRIRGAFGAEAECARTIKNTLPPEAFTEFDEPDVDERTWAGFEERLTGTSSQFSREELREQQKEDALDRILNPVARGEPTADEIRIRAAVSNDF